MPQLWTAIRALTTGQNGILQATEISGLSLELSSLCIALSPSKDHQWLMVYDGLDLEALNEIVERLRYETSSSWRSHFGSGQPGTIMLRGIASTWCRTLNSVADGTWKWHHRLWLDFIENPSPPVLVVKWFSVALLGLAIYHSHQEDRYQNYFLLVGLGCATIVAHLLPQSPMTSLQTYLPFCVILALSLSALVHRIVRASTPNRSRGCYTGGKSKMRAERWFGARKDPSMRKEDMMV